MPRVLLITGSSGIAAATAKIAAAAGDSVFLVGNERDQCEKLSAGLPGSAYSVGDVADEEDVAKAVADCITRMGSIDAAFNVAGRSARRLGDGPLHECSTVAWNKLMEVHAAGTFFVCREVIRYWISSKRGGTILNTSSVLAHFPERERFATVAYAASKGAVESMTISAASYYAPLKIRLNVIAPALVRTPMSARAQSDADILDYIKHKQPLKGDLVDAEEVARIAHFLLSDQSFPMTGEIVRADAGWSVTG
jgi:NAD(P)-dependent dehydrogenase (short-subunit alcohol dehydrogenase family)